MPLGMGFLLFFELLYAQRVHDGKKLVMIKPLARNMPVILALLWIGMNVIRFNSIWSRQTLFQTNVHISYSLSSLTADYSLWPFPASKEATIEPSVGVIVRATKNKLPHLSTLLTSLGIGNANGWHIKVKILTVGPKDEHFDVSVDQLCIMWNSFYNIPHFASRLSVRSDLLSRYSGPKQDYGYALTDAALDQVFEDRLQAPTYLIITNGDNLYTSNLFEKLEPHLSNGTELIGFDFVSHYSWPNLLESGRDVFDDGTMKRIPQQLQYLAFDLGSGVFHKNLFVRDRLRFMQPEGYTFETDARFVETARRMAQSQAILRQVLLVHQ